MHLTAAFLILALSWHLLLPAWLVQTARPSWITAASENGSLARRGTGRAACWSSQNCLARKCCRVVMLECSSFGGNVAEQSGISRVNNPVWSSVLDCAARGTRAPIALLCIGWCCVWKSVLRAGLKKVVELTWKFTRAQDFLNIFVCFPS